TILFGGRKMVTMGNRPQDHRERDLLFGSLLRDYRTRLFRRYSFQLPAWAPSLPKRWLTIDGKTKSLKEWTRESQVSKQTILGRIRRGSTPLQALTTPDERGNYLS